MKPIQFFKSPLIAGLTLGLVGGIIMVLMAEFTNKGPLLLIPLIVPFILSVFVIQLTDTDKKLKKIFLSCFSTYEVILLIFFSYISFYVYPERPIMTAFTIFGINSLIGLGCSLLLTFLVTRKL